MNLIACMTLTEFTEQLNRTNWNLNKGDTFVDKEYGEWFFFQVIDKHETYNGPEPTLQKYKIKII